MHVHTCQVFCKIQGCRVTNEGEYPKNICLVHKNGVLATFDFFLKNRSFAIIQYTSHKSRVMELNIHKVR